MKYWWASITHIMISKGYISFLFFFFFLAFTSLTESQKYLRSRPGFALKHETAILCISTDHHSSQFCIIATVIATCSVQRGSPWFPFMAIHSILWKIIEFPLTNRKEKSPERVHAFQMGTFCMAQALRWLKSCCQRRQQKDLLMWIFEFRLTYHIKSNEGMNVANRMPFDRGTPMFSFTRNTNHMPCRKLSLHHAKWECI